MFIRLEDFSEQFKLMSKSETNKFWAARKQHRVIWEPKESILIALTHRKETIAHQCVSLIIAQ